MNTVASPRTAPPTAEVQSLSHDGRGVARVAGKTVFIAGALPGERVSYRLLHRRRQHDEAEMLQVLQPAAERVAPRCAHFGVCGGCALQHLAAEAQLRAKQRTLRESLARLGGVEPESWLPPLTGPLWGYRRRARLSVRQVRAKGRVLVGFTERHKPFVTDTRRCETLDARVGPLLEPLAALIGSLSIAAHIPQLEVAAGEEAVVLVLRVLEPPSAADRARLAAFEQQHGLRFCLQPAAENSIEPLTPGPLALRYRLPRWQVEIEFQPADFIQVNAEINRRLVDLAVEMLAVEASDRVLDLFCGLGNFTLPLARLAAEVCGIEGEAGLVARARANAARNGLGNVRFLQADLFAEQRDAPWLAGRWDRVLLDPPRAGAREIIECFPRLAARRIVYVSCHPATLARDAGVLVREQGWRLSRAGVLDMFPHTAHVEAIAVFERR